VGYNFLIMSAVFEVDTQVPQQEQQQQQEQPIRPVSSLRGGIVHILSHQDTCPKYRKAYLTFQDNQITFLRDKDADIEILIDLADIAEIKLSTTNELLISFLFKRRKKLCILADCFKVTNWLPSLLKRVADLNEQTKSDISLVIEEHPITVEIVNGDSYEINEKLPEEILSYIFSFTSNLIDLAHISLVCKHWKKVVPSNADTVWKLQFYDRFVEHQVGVPPNTRWRDHFQQRKDLEKERGFKYMLFNPTGLKILTSVARFETWKVNVAIWTGKWYYEVLIGEQCKEMQVGWMGIKSHPKPYGLSLNGVGDDIYSWSYDGYRKQSFFDAKDKEYLSDLEPAKPGDTIGCFLDLSSLTIQWSLNGKEGPVFNITRELPMYAALSVYTAEAQPQFILTSSEFKHKPEGYNGIGDKFNNNELALESILGTRHINFFDRWSWALNRD